MGATGGGSKKLAGLLHLSASCTVNYLEGTLFHHVLPLVSSVQVLPFPPAIGLLLYIYKVPVLLAFSNLVHFFQLFDGFLRTFMRELRAITLYHI